MNARELFGRVRALHDAHPRLFGPLFFLGGVGWDFATLSFERWPDLLLLTVYAALLMVALGVEERLDLGAWVPDVVARRREGVAFSAQFLLGALLSAFGVHVVRALHPGRGVWFAGVLLALALANETKLAAARARTVRYGMAAFVGHQLTAQVTPAFTGMLVPVHVAGLGSAVAVGCVVVLALAPPGSPAVGEPSWSAAARRHLVRPGLAVAGVVLTMGGLIRLGAVPPLPLVLKDAVVATGVEPGKDGYTLRGAQRLTSLAATLAGPRHVPWSPGDEVSLFTRIHAPRGMHLDLVHVWSWHDGTSWVPTDDIRVAVTGGRRDGFRTWTTKRQLRHGSWQVKVRTLDGQELGRVAFEVVSPAG